MDKRDGSQQAAPTDPNELLGFEISTKIKDGKTVPVITLIPRWLAELRTQKPSPA
jgi:hypothetical protein